MKKVMSLLSILTITVFLSSCVTEMESITFHCPTEPVEVGETIPLNYTVEPKDMHDDVLFQFGDDSIVFVTTEHEIYGVSPGIATITIQQAFVPENTDTCEITVIAKKILNDDVFDELVDVITEPQTMDLTDDAYLTYSLSGHDLDYEFYYMQLNIDNDTYVIEYALKDATESVYETGDLSDASGSYEITRLNQPSGFDEFWGFNLVGVNMELYILYYYDDGNLVVDVFDPMTFVPTQ